jgi:hypothetical protein
MVGLYPYSNMKAKDTMKHLTSIEQCTTVNHGALKLKDACEYLGGISPSSVRRLIDRGLLKPNRALRHILIPVSELDRFLGEAER